MRDFTLTFVSDDVDKMQIFNALYDAGIKEFMISEEIIETDSEKFSRDWNKAITGCERGDSQ